MNNLKFTPDFLMRQAEKTCLSARILFEADDMVGAVNRAYYAMFDAARAALLLSDATIKPDAIRTHNGLIRVFSNFMIKDGPLPKEIGSFLRQAYGSRLLSDYSGDPSSPDDAREMVRKAEIFIATIRSELMSGDNDSESVRSASISKPKN